MASRLAGELRKRRPFLNREEEAFLNLQRTGAHLAQSLAALLKPAGLTPTQYNVLRILRGSHPTPLPCGEVGARMVTTVPDVTRLLDRLAERGLVRRGRAARDRRVVEASITKPGLECLAHLDRPLADWLERRLGRLGPDELERLVAVLERLRA